MKIVYFVSFCILSEICLAESPSKSHTTIETQNVTTSIDYHILHKPHHLFVGRCKPEHQVLHQENIILLNDGKSHILAGIRTNVEGPVNITCVKIYDEIPNGEGGYPSFQGGGVGYNYIEFNVMTEYGKGFHFFVQIYGVDLDPDTTNGTLPLNRPAKNATEITQFDLPIDTIKSGRKP